MVLNMNPIAFEQATDRLERAEQSIANLKSATSYKEAERAWNEFLASAYAMYNKLEQGAKSSKKSEQWFARKKGQRRSDPLLRYLRYARNSDEHGVEYVTQRVDGGNDFFNKAMAFGEVIDTTFTAHETENGPPIGEPFAGRLHGPTIKLIRAHDRRYNDYCDPPTEHLGQPIKTYDHPMDVAPAALSYLKAMIDEAKALVA